MKETTRRFISVPFLPLFSPFATSSCFYGATSGFFTVLYTFFLAIKIANIKITLIKLNYKSKKKKSEKIIKMEPTKCTNIRVASRKAFV